MQAGTTSSSHTRPFGPRIGFNGQAGLPISQNPPTQPISEEHSGADYASPSRRPFGPRIPQRKNTAGSTADPVTDAPPLSAGTSLLSVVWADSSETSNNPEVPPAERNTSGGTTKSKRSPRPLPPRPRNALHDPMRRRLPPTMTMLPSSQDIPFSFSLRIGQYDTNSEDPIKDPFGQQDGVPSDSPLWKNYMEEAKQQDQINIGNWNQSMDVILIFAGLFSAILTAFLIEFYHLLQPDSNQAVVNQLITISSLLQATLAPNSSSSAITNIQTINSQPFIAANSAIAVNVLWFVSLTCSLGAAIGAMVIKQWLQFYGMDLSPNAYEYTHQHQYRYSALQNWHVPSIISALPFIMLISVGLFLAGLALQLLLLNTIVAIVVISFLALVLLCYGLSLILPLLYPGCPYKTSALVLFKSFYHSTRSWISWLFYKPRGRPNVIPLARENPEIWEIRKLQPQLLVSSISWLLGISQKEETIHHALMSVSKVNRTDDMVYQLLKCNALEKLVHRAIMPLPSLGHSFWNTMEFLTPSHFIFRDNSSARAYMRVLISVWHHPSYLALDKPPAISYNSQKDSRNPGIKIEDEKNFQCLLGDWLLLWRMLKQIHNNQLSVLAKKGFDLNLYANIVCVEVCNYHLQKYVTPLYLPQNRGAFIDLHYFLEAINAVGQRELGLDDDTVWLLLDTLAYVFSGMDDVSAPIEIKGIPRTWFSHSQSPSLTRQETVLLLVKLLESNNMQYNLTTKKLLLCLQMLLPVPMISASRRDFFIQYQQESPSRSQLFEQLNITLAGLLQVFIPELNTGIRRLHSPQENTTSEMQKKVAFLAVEQLYESILQADFPKTDYDDLLLSLPPCYLENLFQHILSTELSTFNNKHAGVCWMIGLLSKWCINNQKSTENIQRCTSIVQKLMSLSWSEDQYNTLSDKMMSFLEQLWIIPGPSFGNLVCNALCIMLENSLLAAQKDRKLVKYLTGGTKTLLEICSFLASNECTENCKKSWRNLTMEWERQRQGYTPSAPEVYQFRTLKGVLEIPGNSTK